jgi:hypothetical protein
MTAGRKPIEFVPQEKTAVDNDQVNRDLASAEQLGKAIQGYGQGRDLVNQLLGQAQAFQAAGDLLRTFGVSKLAIVKENKLYQQLAGSTTPNGSELKGTWVEFCNLLGISDDKANQDIANLQAFGEEALENMQRVGIGYRDLRQFRKLPADQRTALIEAAKEGDKASLLELAEDLIAKHAKEKESLNKQVSTAEADLATAKEVARRRDERINRLEEENARLTAEPKPPRTPAMEEEERLRFMTDHGLMLVREIEVGLRSHFALIDKLFPDGVRPNHVQLAQQQAVSQVIQAARVLAGDYGILLQQADIERPDLLWLTQSEQIFGATPESMLDGADSTDEA